ncbi:hypothetical protein SAMN05216389_11063 [Oceanobacillus limi]|uniref:KOW motif-containing protein n=1 Tax=Oceanobacillus limi TaxID=930131 RepID=A0A1I0E2B2_9BACI|nr:DUF2187 family protein [Oceanobacillus limi]SET38859.1 hypothetical protein SAMN05216389_11063 [Oceanobacillus limi]
MADENVVEENKAPVNKADEGDIIEVVKGEYKGELGKVLMVRENSVIINIGENKKTGEPIKTVVNHKNYKQVK